MPAPLGNRIRPVNTPVPTQPRSPANSAGTPTVVPETNASNTPPAAPADASTVQAHADAPVDESGALAAAERVQDFFADGELDTGEAAELLDLLENGEVNLDDLDSGQQAALRDKQGGARLDAIGQNTETSDTPAETDNTAETGREITDSRMSDRMSTADRATGRRSDVSYNFLMTQLPPARQTSGFFAQEATRFQGIADAADNPAAKDLADNMGQLYRTLAQSTQTRSSQREGASVAVMEQATRTLDALAALPEGTLDSESIRQISQNINDISTIAAAYPGLAGTNVGTHPLPTALDRFTANVVQRQRQIEGTAVSGQRNRSNETPDIQGALQTFTNDQQDMRTVLQRLNSLQTQLQGGNFASAAEYQQAVRAAAPGSSDAFLDALGNLGGAQFRAREAEQTAQRGVDKAEQAENTADRAITSLDAAQTEITSASQNMTRARELLGQYRELSSQSRGQSREAQDLRSQAMALAGEARQMLGRVKNSDFAGTLSSQTQGVERDLSTVTALTDQIAQRTAALNARLDASDARSGTVEADIETVEARQLREQENEQELEQLFNGLDELGTGSEIGANLTFRLGVGNQLASLTGGVRVGIHAEKAFGHGAPFILRAEIALEAQAKAELFGLIEASATFESAFRGGVGFYESSDVQAFTQKINGVLSLLDNPIGNQTEIRNQMRALDAFVEQRGYTNQTNSQTVELGVGDNKITGSRSSGNSTFNRPVDDDGDGVADRVGQQNVRESGYRLAIETDLGISASVMYENTSLLNDSMRPRSQGTGGRQADQSRTVIGLTGNLASLSANLGPAVDQIISGVSRAGVSGPPISRAHVERALSDALGSGQVSTTGSVSLYVSVDNTGRTIVSQGTRLDLKLEGSGSSGTVTAGAEANAYVDSRRVIYDSHTD